VFVLFSKVLAHIARQEPQKVFRPPPGILQTKNRYPKVLPYGTCRVKLNNNDRLKPSSHHRFHLNSSNRSRPPLSLSSFATDPAQNPKKPRKLNINHFDDNINSNDYINASPVKLQYEGSNHHYIAAAAPTPHAMEDWWQMIYENKIKTVIMLTKCQEGKQSIHIINCLMNQ